MPRVQRGETLLERLQKIVKDCDGYGRAAQRLGAGKMPVWPFCTSGCAIDRTRARLSEAIKSYENDSGRNINE